MAWTFHNLNNGGTKLINATSGTPDTIVTNAASTDTLITGIILHNTHTVAIIVTLCHVEDSDGEVGSVTIGAASCNVTEFWQQSIAASDTVFLSVKNGDALPILEDTNDTLQAYAGTADKVNIFVYGCKKVT